MILHLVSTSSFTDNHLANCLEIITPADALLLMGDGVYALTDSRIWEELPTIKEVFAIEEDCLARAVKVPADRQWQLINFGEMVDVVARYPLSQSWF